MQLSKRTRLVLAVVFLFLLSMCNLPATANQMQSGTPALIGPTTVMVHPDGSGDYATIQDAVNRLADGSGILLDEGMYLLPETVNFSRTISLIGVGKNKTIIHSTAAGAGFKFEGEGVFSAEGITFEHGGDESASVLILNAAQASISDCRLSGARQNEGEDGDFASMVLSGDTLAEVKQSELSSNSVTGLRVLENAQLIIADSRLTNNQGHGLVAKDQAVVTMTDFRNQW